MTLLAISVCFSTVFSLAEYIDALKQSAVSGRHEKHLYLVAWSKKTLKKKKVRDRLQKDADIADINYSVVWQSMRSCFLNPNELKHLSARGTRSF